MQQDSPPIITAQPEEKEHHAGGWFPPLLIAVALAAEILCVMLMTLVRYQNQGLEPSFLEFAKSADFVGLLVGLPFILLFVVLAFLPRFHTVRLVSALAAFSCTGLTIVIVGLFADSVNAPDIFGGYLAYKALELAILIVTIGPHKAGRTFWQKTLRVAILVITILAGVYTLVIVSVLLSPIAPTVLERPGQEYDAAVILGAAVWSGDKPSPVLRERINKGYDLLKNGSVEFLVLTGGNAPNELSEAEVAKRELLKLGADPTRIVLEEKTRSTVEQILFVRDQLLKQGWSSFIIVSDQFHLKRALEICEFNGINAYGVSSESPLGPQNLAIYHLRESAALILYWTFGL